MTESRKEDKFLGIPASTPKLNKALCEARGNIKNPPMDSVNPHFKNKFASLKAVVESVVPVMAEHGIAVVQDIQTVDDGIVCYTHLFHESGEDRTFGPLKMRATKNDPQGYASASTYARRYHLMAVGCVVGDADDDGNAASESPFSSVQARTKARKLVLEAAENGEHDDLVKHWREALDNDQKADLWGSFSKDQQRLITEGLKEPEDAVPAQAE